MSLHFVTMAGWISTVLILLVAFSETTNGDSHCIGLPLGVESGAILDSQLSATTSQNVLRDPRNARLHRNYGDGGWYPSIQDDKQYLTIDLIHMTKLTGVATQGAVSGGYAKTYKLEYSMDGETWEVYKVESRTKIFEGNTDTSHVTKHTFPEPVTVKMVRFNPMDFDDLGMRVEVYGCYEELSIAQFNGTSYLRYSNADHKPFQTEEEYIRFRFRTDRPNGILMHAFGSSGDYLLFQLLNSKLVVTLNLGNSHISDGDSWIEGGNLLDDNHWHLVAFKRNRQDLKLTVDGASVANYTNGQYMKLDLNQQIYIGGTEFLSRNELMTSELFVGCIQQLLMSDSLEEGSLRIALDFIAEVYRGVKPQISVVGEISDRCGGGPSSVSITFPERESHIRWPDTNLDSFNVQFQFRTFERNSYMVYNRLVFSGVGLILVALRDSSLVVIVQQNQDSSPVTVPAGYDLNDGLWHHVKVELTQRSITIALDGLQTTIERNLFATRSPYYYFGGTNSLTLAETFDLPAFRGCMKEIFIHGVKLDIIKAIDDATEGVEFEGLEIDSCGLKDWCSPNPCEHGGECTPEWESFTCTCTGHYTGATCHTSRVEQSCEQIGSSGTYIIDPDGSGPLQGVQVDCEIDGDNIWTVMNHDAEAEEDIPQGSVAPGSFDRPIRYLHVPFEEMTYIIDNAQHCEQTVHYTCNSAKLLNSPAGDPFGWWVDRHGSDIYSWGDAYVNSRKCSCGMTRDCSDPNKFCNCDADVTNGLTDEGALTDKDLLPVTRLQFGDVSQGSSASFRLGKLRCRGDAQLEDAVTFRTAEAHLALPVKLTREGALDISFQFKTTVTQAVLMSAEGRERTHFQVELHNPSEVVMRFDFGGGETTLSHQSDAPINDDEWRTIRLNLDLKEINLQIDSETKQSLTLVNGHREFEIASDLFVGTTPSQTDGFVGCIRKLQVNGKTFNLRRASELAQEVVKGCSGHCSVEPCLFGGRCIEGYSGFSCDCSNTYAEGEHCAKEVGAEMGTSSSIEYTLPVSLRQASEVDNITLGFTTSAGSGVLMRVENEGARYQQISLESGALSYKYKLTEGLERSLKVSQHNFGDDGHHFVYVVRSETDVTLKVDEYPIQRESLTSPVLFTPGRLIVGAAINGGQNFQGCISRVHFNSTSVNISPVKLYFDENKPSDVRGSGSITQSQCRVHNIPPPLLPKEPPVGTPTDPPTTESMPEAGSVLAPGDKATIAIIVILLFLAFMILVFIITSYMHRHKGEQLPPPPRLRTLHHQRSERM